MISYEFTAGKDTDPVIVKMTPEHQDYLEVPLRLLLPHHYTQVVSTDWLQEKITAAVEKMVGELNAAIK